MASRVTTRTRSPRRKLIWARANSISPSTLTAGGFGIVDLLSAFETLYGAQLIGCTVMRIRGTLSMTNMNPATGTSQYIGWGIRVVDTAELATATAASGPLSDPGADWMAYGVEFADFYTTVANSGSKVQTIDVRSRRKIDELGQGLALFYQAPAAAPNTQFAQAALSVLIALP